MSENSFLGVHLSRPRYRISFPREGGKILGDDVSQKLYLHFSNLPRVNITILVKCTKLELNEQTSEARLDFSLDYFVVNIGMVFLLNSIL